MLALDDESGQLFDLPGQSIIRQWNLIKFSHFLSSSILTAILREGFIISSASVNSFFLRAHRRATLYDTTTALLLCLLALVKNDCWLVRKLSFLAMKSFLNSKPIRYWAFMSQMCGLEVSFQIKFFVVETQNLQIEQTDFRFIQAHIYRL